jgi:hypothetical protein
MHTLNYALKRGCKELFSNSRWDLLTMLILHANVRGRCWPSTRALVEGTGKSSATLTDAKEWLLEHGAIVLVPFEKRVAEELRLPGRQHIYQLTGRIEVDGNLIPYLYMDGEVLETEILVSENFRNQNLSVSSKNTSVSSK